MAITSREDAKVLLEMIDSGEITGDEAERAWDQLDQFQQGLAAEAAPDARDRMPVNEKSALYRAALPSAASEAAQRLYGGVKQAYGNLKDMANATFNGKPYIGPDVRLGDGTIIRGQGLETSAGRKATAEEVVRRQTATAESAARGEDPKAFRNIAAAGEFGTLAIAPEFAGPKALTATGALAKNAWAGFLGSSLQFDADDNKTGDVVIGTLAGPVLGLVPSIPAASRNFIGDLLRNGPKRAEEAVAGATRAMPNVKLSLAQRTGIPELIALERAAYDTKLTNFFADQTDTAIADIVKYTRTWGADDANMRKRVSGYAGAMNQKLRKLSAIANEGWDAGLADVANMERGLIPQPGVPGGPTTYVQGGVPQTQGPVNVGIGGSRLNMPADNFRSQMDAQLAMARNRVENNVTPATRQRLEAMDQLLKKGGKAGLSAEQLSSFMKGLTAMGKDDPAAARKLRIALDQDIDNLAMNGSQAQSAVAKRLLDVRAEYKRALAAKEALAENEAYKLLNVDAELRGAQQKRAAPTPSELMAGYRKLSPERQADVRVFMEDHAPKLLAQMKDRVVLDAVADAKAILPAGDSRQSLEVLTDSLFGKGSRLYSEGLFTPAELARFEDVKDGLRLISTNRPSVRGAGTRILPEDVAINLVVRHAGFMARQATRMLMGSKASTIFTDPDLYNNLRRMKQSTTGTPANLLARAAVLERLQDLGEVMPEEGQ